MPIGMFDFATAPSLAAGKKAVQGMRLLTSLFSAGVMMLGTASGAAAADQKAEILFAPSAAQVAGLVTQALSASNYELKQAYSDDAMEEFCKAENLDRPMIVVSAVEMASHIEGHCGAGKIAKGELGYMALVLVQKASDPPMTLTSRQIYLAISDFIPAGEGEKVKRNTAKTWSEVDTALPGLPIKVLLPGEQDASRGIFDAEALVAACREFPEIQRIFEAESRINRCLKLRSDVVEKQSAVADRLAALKAAAPGSVALVTEGAEVESEIALRIIPFNGNLPTPEDVVAEDYTLTVPLYLYARADQVSGEGGSEALRSWFLEALSERAIGENGYLDRLGFVSVPAATRDWQRREVSE